MSVSKNLVRLCCVADYLIVCVGLKAVVCIGCDFEGEAEVDRVCGGGWREQEVVGEAG